MKRIASVLIVVAALSAGCAKQGPGPGEVRISGVFRPAVPGSLHITAGPVLDSARISKSGEFSITIPLAEPMKAMLFFGNRISDVYLEPGKEVTLDINSAVVPENITYGGQLGPVNHYLVLAKRLDQQTAVPETDLFAREPDAFLRFSDSVKQLKTQLINEYQERYKEIDPRFVTRIKSEIELAWADDHLRYPMNYQIVTGRQPVLQAGYHPDYMSLLNLNGADNLESPVYKQFIQNFLDFRQSLYLEAHPDAAGLIFPESVARFRVIHQEFSNQQVLDYLLYTALTDHLANFGTIRVESFVTDFKLSCKNPEYLKTIDAAVANLEKVGTGKPAPDFTAFTPDGKKVKLSDYFGEMLYIGFWASWSSWSLQEIPYFEQLRKDFGGRPVKFIMVSMDFEKDKNRWAAIIEKNNFGSIQLHQDPESTVLNDQYFMNDFPRYFLIGKDGKIISVFAPRPTENIAVTLNRILSGSYQK
jgi:alkyl hydroperoxide reductase subunit AhpC